MNGYVIAGVLVAVIILLLATNKKLVETLKNIYKIEELRKRVFYTIGLLLVYRLGCFVVIPGINPNMLGTDSALANQMDSNALLGLLDVFSGGAFANAAILALGVMPYITASIIIQLLGIMVPAVQKLQKEGESGRRKMNQWTRLLTIGVLALQGTAYVANLYNQLPGEAFVFGSSVLFTIYATVILIAGIGGLSLSFGKVTITSIACALILGIIVNLILSCKCKKSEE